jgi:hypothetical protein
MKIQILPPNSLNKGMSDILSVCLKSIAVVCFLLISQLAYSQIGTWTAVTSLAPHANNGVMILMTDGTVMCHNSNGGSDDDGTGWDKLTPSATGSYANGTWTTAASMNNDRLFFPSQVLPSGELFVAGGEYGTGDTAGEIYNPVTNTWKRTEGVVDQMNIYDGNSELLYNGTVLVGLQFGSNPSYDDQFYTPSTDKWTTAPLALLDHDEAAWVKLPDSSILFVGINATASCRYEPKTNTFIADAPTPVDLYDPLGEEAGSAVLLPNGKAIFFGATGHNCIYTPTGTTAEGSWVAAPDFPTINGSITSMDDAPSAMMVNGHILCGVGPAPTASAEFFNPLYFVEYDYVSNTFTQVTSNFPAIGKDYIASASSYQANLLDLPDGTVLMSIDQQAGDTSQKYYIYTPGGSPIVQGKPTINNITESDCSIYTITGKLFNGISEGAQYGDDWQMSSNYPLVRLTNGTNVFYAKTTNWNRLGAVQTDSLEDTAQFTLPSMPGGTYSLVVVANGFASSPTLFSTFGLVISAQTNISCSSLTGSATVSATDGVLPYTYSWSPSGGTDSTASNLSVGAYTVTVTDGGGCSVSAPVIITSYSISVSAATTANSTCGSTGSASSSVSGGTKPYTYSWAPSGGSTDTATGLSAGGYTLTVTDSCGAVGTASVIIAAPYMIEIEAYLLDYVGCSNGEAEAYVYDGTSPYTYLWSPSAETTAIATGLGVGEYTVTVTDNCGVSATAEVDMTQIAMEVYAYTLADSGCTGGSATAEVYYGASPYTYLWTPSGETTATATGLSVGEYSVTVTDSCGNTGTSYTYIYTTTLDIDPYELSTDIGCSGGSAAAYVYYGTSPYKYSWSPSGQTTDTATGLSVGEYTLTVTDSCGAIGIGYIYIDETTMDVDAYELTEATCNGGGSTDVYVYYGTPPYTYSWSPSGETTAIATGLSAGEYTLTVTDSCGNSGVGYVYLYQTTIDVDAYELTEANCNEGGSAMAYIYDGAPPYTYSWAPSGGNKDTATGLSAGEYTLTVTDSCGNSSIGYVYIYQDILEAYAYTDTYVSCNGTNTGSATAYGYDGTSPYTYDWTPSGETTATATGLSAGSYTVTVTDNCGDVATATITTFEYPVDVYAYALTTVPCHGGNTGSVTADVYDGTAPYNYYWSPTGETTATISGLSAGVYTVTVTDQCGSTATASVSTFEDPVYLDAYIETDVKCNGGYSGSAVGYAYDGTAPYNYLWTPSGETTEIATGLSAGVYTISVTDQCGSSVAASVDITQPVAISVANYFQNDAGGNSGLAAVTATGGVAPYSYFWAPGNQTTDTIKGLSTGTYCCVVFDANDCNQSVCITINYTGIDNISNSSGINIYPNPSKGLFTIQSSAISGQRSIEVYNELGQKVYSQFNIQNPTFNIDLSSNPNGVYLIRILNTDGTLVTEKKMIKTQ